MTGKSSNALRALVWVHVVLVIFTVIYALLGPRVAMDILGAVVWLVGGIALLVGACWPGVPASVRILTVLAALCYAPAGGSHLYYAAFPPEVIGALINPLALAGFLGPLFGLPAVAFAGLKRRPAAQ